jgi:hypothetical protein
MPKRFREFERGVRASRRMRARGVAFWRNEPNEHFGQTKPSGEHARERRTNPRLCEMTAGAISLFRIVIYNEVCNPHVPAALSAQDFAKQHARGRAAAVPSHSNWVALLVARHRGHFKRTVREDFASGPGVWLRLSRPAQSLMTRA